MKAYNIKYNECGIQIVIASDFSNAEKAFNRLRDNEDDDVKYVIKSIDEIPSFGDVVIGN